MRLLADNMGLEGQPRAWLTTSPSVSNRGLELGPDVAASTSIRVGKYLTEHCALPLIQAECALQAT
jgi:hypothetical protein